jgi:hypothetical protein
MSTTSSTSFSRADLAVNYVRNPKNFFYGVSTCAYFGYFSPKTKAVAEKITKIADGVYDACTWPGLYEAMADFYKERTFVNFVGFLSYATAAAEFLHAHDFVQLGKKIPYLQTLGNLSDIVWSGADLYGRCKQIHGGEKFNEAIGNIVKDIISIAEAAFLLLALAYGPACVLPFVTNLLLDTVYLAADYYLKVVYPSFGLK